jgi:hypothetical protein
MSARSVISIAVHVVADKHLDPRRGWISGSCSSSCHRRGAHIWQRLPLAAAILPGASQTFSDLHAANSVTVSSAGIKVSTPVSLQMTHSNATSMGKGGGANTSCMQVNVPCTRHWNPRLCTRFCKRFSRHSRLLLDWHAL